MGINIKRILLIIIIILFFGGVGALTSLWQNIFEFFKILFPVFYDVTKMKLEDYLTSPYFITGIIMSVASAFGIWIGKKRGSILFMIISIIIEFTSLASLMTNIF